MSEVMKSLANICRARNTTKTELARRIGINERTIRGWGKFVPTYRAVLEFKTLVPLTTEEYHMLVQACHQDMINSWRYK